MSRGQIFSSDLMIAVFIFIIIFSAVLMTWNTIIDTSSRDAEKKNIEIAASTTIDTLLRSSGYPADWTAANVKTIGLAGWDRTIDAAKLDEFVNMDYNLSKDVMGIGNYDYQIRFAKNNIVKGFLGSKRETAIFVRRIVILNGVETVEFTLWK